MDPKVKNKQPAAQVAFAKKAAALKAASNKASALTQALREANEEHQRRAGLGDDQRQPMHDRKRVHAPRAPPAERLLDKAEVLHITGVTFPTIWLWMRQGKFPRSRIVGGKSMWISSEIEAWLAELPLRPLKGDEPEAA
jgi:prophage regulatory protein